MMKNLENNGTEEIGLVTPTPGLWPIETDALCLITVVRELRQQHPRELLFRAGTLPRAQPTTPSWFVVQHRLRSRDVPPGNKSRGCCWRNSRSTVINPDYNMINQLCMKRLYGKMRSNYLPNRATSPSCLHCDVTHFSLTTGVVALHIPWWRAREHE